MVLWRADRPIGTRWCGGEPTLEEILPDHIVRAVMEADGVDPQALAAHLRSLAREIAAVRHAGRELPRLFE